MSLTFMPADDAAEVEPGQPTLWVDDDQAPDVPGADDGVRGSASPRVIENGMYADDTVDERLEGLTFRLCAFRDVSFDGARELRGCVFEKCVFIGCSFKSVALTNCSFNVCVFKQADFFDALLKDCRMLGCEVLGAHCTAMTAHGGDWSYSNLAGLKFAHQELRDVRLREAALTDCTFKDCDLTGSDLTRATVHGASFTSCDLRGARLDGVAVVEATWSDSKIDLAQCIVIAQEVTGAVYEEPVG